MKTFFELEREQFKAASAPTETEGFACDTRDPLAPACSDLPYSYRLGAQIRRSRLGLENSFVKDIVDYDSDPNSYDPYADIRSTYDERQAFKSKLDAERKKRHEQTTGEDKGVSSSTSTAPVVAAPVSQPSPVTAE